MPENLYAACRTRNGFAIKRVQLDSTIQELVEGIFDEQEQRFFDGIEEEIAFDGSWKPDVGQLLTAPLSDEAGLFVSALEQNITAFPPIDTASLGTEGIKALFTGRVAVEGAGTRVLIQRFTASQVLSRRICFVEAGNTFRRLTAPAFSLDSSLTCVIEGGELKFRSFNNLQSIIDTTELYREATEPEARSFAEQQCLMVDDVEAFVQATDQKIIRKMIRSIATAGILETYTPAHLQAAATEASLAISIQDDKIVLPSEPRAMRDLLTFLNDQRLKSTISGRAYLTNSRRLAPT